MEEWCVPPLCSYFQYKRNSSPGTCYCWDEMAGLMYPLQLPGISEVCINGGGIFSFLLFLSPLSPNVGGEIASVPLDPLGFDNCPCSCWVTESVQSQLSSRGQMLFPTSCLVADRAEMQNGPVMPSLVLCAPPFKDTGLCSSVVGYSLPEGFAIFPLK